MSRYRFTCFPAFVLLVFIAVSFNVVANTPLRVAVASNFSDTAKKLVKAYTLNGHQPPQLLFGSTGKHAAQISNGLEVGLLLAADIERPAMLESTGLGVYGSRVSYALGRLVLWVSDSAQSEWPASLPADLKGIGASSPASSVDSQSNFQRDTLLESKSAELITKVLTDAPTISLANPSLAPYGVASKDILSRFERGEHRLVYGENVSQVVHFVASGSVDAAFIPLSMIDSVKSGVIIKIPSRFYKPIEQQMLLISEAPEARRFYDFILSTEGQYIIQNNGYDLPNG